MSDGRGFVYLDDDLMIFRKLFGIKKQPIKWEDPAETKEAFVTGMVKRGYLSYEDPAEHDKFVAHMTASFHPDVLIAPMIDEQTRKHRGHRCYYADGEELYEHGSVSTMLSTLAPLFDKMAVHMDVSDHYESIDEQWLLTHRLTINGVVYTLFDQYEIDSMEAWAVAPYRFAMMINDQLARQHSTDRLYLIGINNDWWMVFLTDEQYDYIRRFASSREANPLLPDAWAKMHGVTI